MKVRIFLIISGLLLLSIFSFTASSDEPVQTNRVITVEISGFKYTPNPITLEPGETVTFEVTNKDSIPHTFTVNGDKLLDLGGGKSGSANYTAPAMEQTLPITCDYHSSMKADLVVQAAGASSTTSSDSSASSTSSTSPTSDSTSASDSPVSSSTNPVNSSTDSAPFPVTIVLFAFISIFVLRRRNQ